MAGSRGEGVLRGPFYGVAGERAFIFSRAFVGGGSEFHVVAVHGANDGADTEAAVIGAGDLVTLLMYFECGISAAEGELYMENPIAGEVSGESGDCDEKKEKGAEQASVPRSRFAWPPGIRDGQASPSSGLCFR
jgi:hypothetical protein